MGGKNNLIFPPNAASFSGADGMKELVYREGDSITLDMA